MTHTNENAPAAETTRAHERVSTPGSPKKYTPQPDLNARTAAALIALIVDKYFPQLHTEDSIFDPSNMSLRDVQAIVTELGLPEDELWELAAHK